MLMYQIQAVRNLCPTRYVQMQAVEVQVTGKGGWTLTGTLQLNPVSGPAVAWSLRCIDG